MPLSPRTRPVRLPALFAALALATTAGVLAPRAALAGELAVAEGPIAIHEPAVGERSVACDELFVEARDALDNHLIAQSRPALAEDGTCRYAISVPAQSAVWLRLRPALVAAARATSASGTTTANAPGGPPFVPSSSADHRISSRGVQIRWTVIAPATNFFAPGEHKTVPLTY